MRHHPSLRWLPIVLALIVGVSIAIWPPLKFVNLGGADFASRFSVLVFFSLLIERTVEILMSIWRSEEANKREATVQRLVASGIAATDQRLIDAKESLISYKAETLQWTMPRRTVRMAALVV